MTPSELGLYIEEAEMYRQQNIAMLSWQIGYLGRVEEFPSMQDWVPTTPPPPIDDSRLEGSIQFAKSIGLEGPWG